MMQARPWAFTHKEGGITRNLQFYLEDSPTNAGVHSTEGSAVCRWLCHRHRLRYRAQYSTTPRLLRMPAYYFGRGRTRPGDGRARAYATTHAGKMMRFWWGGKDCDTASVRYRQEAGDSSDAMRVTASCVSVPFIIIFRSIR